MTFDTQRDRIGRQILCGIAQAAFDSVSAKLERDQLLAQTLRSSITTSRQIYDEEAITVEMAATLVESYKKYTKMTLFTHPEEKKIGSDWYWNISVNNKQISALVQAKRVRRTEFGQDDRDGEVHIDIGQLRDLVQVVNSRTVEQLNLRAWVLLYARYSADPPCGKQDLSACLNHNHGNVCRKVEPSIWIAPAQEIIQQGKDKMKVRNFVENAVRLDCVLPCSGMRQSRVGPWVKNIVPVHSGMTFSDSLAVLEAQDDLLSRLFGAIYISDRENE